MSRITRKLLADLTLAGPLPWLPDTPTDGGAGGGGGAPASGPPAAGPGGEGGTGTDTALNDLQKWLTEHKLTPEQAKARVEASRKWEDRAKSRQDYDQIKAELEQLRQASLSDSDRAIEQARAEARAAGEAEATSRLAGQLVQSELRGMLTARIVKADGTPDTERINRLVARAPAGDFLGEDHTVDSDALRAFVDDLAPAPQQQDGSLQPLGGAGRGSNPGGQGFRGGAGGDPRADLTDRARARALRMQGKAPTQT